MWNNHCHRATTQLQFIIIIIIIIIIVINIGTVPLEISVCQLSVVYNHVLVQ